jgi:peptide/nickel transport system permease protein
MQKYALQRFFQSVLALLFLTMIVFAMTHATGDSVSMLVHEEATLEDVERVRKSLGLDKPLVVQYFVYLGDLARGDLGNSLRERRPATEILKERIPATFQLGLVATLFATLIAIPVGVLSAVKRGTVVDLMARLFALLGQAVPPFWLGIVLILIFSVTLGLLPVAGNKGPLSFILPAITAGWYMSAGMMRLTRSAMLEVLDSEYVKLARAKGASRRTVIWKHAFRNTLIPVVTFGGMMLAGLLHGIMVVEMVFAWPGLGRAALQGVYERDTSVVQATILVFALLYLGMNFIVDILYAYIDPRIRYN